MRKTLPHIATHINVNASLLQICFPVKVGRLDETNAVNMGGAEQQHICWNDVVLAQANNVAHLHVTPLHASIVVQAPVV